MPLNPLHLLLDLGVALHDTFKLFLEPLNKMINLFIHYRCVCIRPACNCNEDRGDNRYPFHIAIRRTV
jgi:hypothetical protein